MSENCQKIAKSSKKHVLLYYINGGTFQIMQMRTPAVQPPTYVKNHEKLNYYNGGAQV